MPFGSRRRLGLARARVRSMEDDEGNEGSPRPRQSVQRLPRYGPKGQRGHQNGRGRRRGFEFRDSSLNSQPFGVPRHALERYKRGLSSAKETKGNGGETGERWAVQPAAKSLGQPQ